MKETRTQAKKDRFIMTKTFDVRIKGRRSQELLGNQTVEIHKHSTVTL